MINDYLSLQSNRLDEIGQRKRERQQKEHQERESLRQLEELRRTLPLENGQSASYHQKRMLMQQHLTELIGDQKQQIEIAKTDLNMEQQALVAQYRKVKAFELLQEKQRSAEDRKARRDEQRELDDWVSRSRRRS